MNSIKALNAEVGERQDAVFFDAMDPDDPVLGIGSDPSAVSGIQLVSCWRRIDSQTLFFHVGFAANTPNGVVVPVIWDADKKGILDIAKEMARLSAQARGGKLKPADMQDACFAISSLGGIGNTGLAPTLVASARGCMGRNVPVKRDRCIQHVRAHTTGSLLAIAP
jgi:2-oxoacid dehydrogenases acyltransferase (catalytic domain)